jgi:hypothetical protein
MNNTTTPRVTLSGKTNEPPPARVVSNSTKNRRRCYLELLAQQHLYAASHQVLTKCFVSRNAMGIVEDMDNIYSKLLKHRMELLQDGNSDETNRYHETMKRVCNRALN